MQCIQSKELDALEVMITSRSRTLSIAGDPLSHQAISDAYVLWIALCIDLGCRSLGRLTVFVRYLTSVSYEDVMADMGSIYSYLQHCEHHSMSMRSFKDQPLPSGYSASSVLRPIWHVVEDLVKNTKPSSFRSVIQFLRFCSKLVLKNPALEVKALDDWLSIEEDLKKLSLAGSQELICRCNMLLRATLKAWKPDFFPFRHGAGSTADFKRGTSDAVKFSAIGSTPALRYLARKTLNIELDPRPQHRCCKVLFVPKSYKAVRTISSEPTGLQYYQQGVRRSLYRYMEEHPVLGCDIRLRNSEYNQRLALKGSDTHDLATVDLSAASDRISVKLVKQFFKGTQLLPWLLATRSLTARLPGGGVVELEKFAPMGSALCFPVECLVFWAVSKVIVHAAGCKTALAVYGDDIVIDSSLAPFLMEQLETLGLRVNRDKSFTYGSYKESCGIEAYKGHDVRPIYWRAPRSKIGYDPSAVCDVANATFERFPKLRQAILRLPRTGPLLFGDYPGCVKTYCTPPWNAVTRWNSDLQRVEARALVACPATADETKFDLPHTLSEMYWDAQLITERYPYRSAAAKKPRLRLGWLPYGG